ncbi:MAG: glycosyltransferase family 4 protein [Patescibacteria group bacterium]
MKKLRIAMIGQKAVPFYRDGGVERHVEELSTRLAERGHDVTVYVRPRYVATSDDIWRGVRLRRLPSVPTKHLDAWSHTLFSSVHVVGSGADIIHYHSVGPSTLAFLPRLFARRAKIVSTFHSIDRFHKKWGAFARTYLSFGEWAATHFPHATIAVSESIQKYCRERFGKEVAYIPNGVSIVPVSGSGELARWGLEPGKYIIAVARLIRHKGLHYLVEAFKRIPDTIKGEMKLVIVGAPSYTSDYEFYLKNLAAEDHRIIFTGYQTGEALNQLYAHSLFYVHPSEAEGLAITILEAMSFGKCVLMSDIPENLEARDHSGIAFASGNVEDLQEKMTSLINHPEITRERGKKAMDFIRQKFEWEKIVDQIESLYLDLVTEK